MTMSGRLMLSYLAVTLAILLVLGIPLGIFFRTLEVDRLTAATERDATTLATLVEDVLELDLPVDDTTAVRYSTDTGARVVVTDDAGISLVDTAAPVDRDLSTRPEIESALAGRPSSGTRRSETLDDELLYVAVPVASGGTTHGAVRLTLGTAELNEQVGRFWFGIAAMGALVLLIATGVGWTMARWVTRPVRQLAATAERFASGDLSAEPDQPGAPAEIVGLQRRMNEMAERLDAQLAEQRAFVADASHQLRTPLTALRLRLENTQEQLRPLATQEADPGALEVQRSELTAAVSEVDRLTELVAGLLRLARAEQRSGDVTETADLCALARDRVDTWHAVAEAEEVDLAFSAEVPDLPVLATASGVEQVLDNLIDNAVAAAAAGGTKVVVEVGAEHEGAWLTVSDDGAGLDDEDKQRAVDRFWRGHSERPGTGLGLPIVAELMDAFGGDVTLGDSPEGGLQVTLRFRVPT